MNLQAWKEDPAPQPIGGRPDAATSQPAPPEEQAAEEEGEPFSIHLLNDGFQQRQLARHVDILLINRRDWTDRLLPAGHLREPHRALFRANAIAIPYSEPELEAVLRAWDWTGPIWRHRSVLDVPVIKEPVTAFCGIARPSQFFEGLETVGLNLVSQHSFPNHFAYTRLMVKELIAEAFEHEARAIVTTSKDVVRLGTLVSLFPPTMPLVNARLRTEIANIDSVIEWLAGRLG